MCRSVKNLVEKVLAAVRRVWAKVRKFLAVLIVVAAIFFPYLWPLVSAYLPAAVVTFVTATFAATGTLFATTWGGFVLRGLIAFGVAHIVSAEGAQAAADLLGDAVRSGVEAVASVTGSAAGGLLDALSSNPLFLIGAGVAIWYLFFREKDKTVIIERPEPVTDNVAPIGDGQERSYA